ncbi:NAD(P)H-hydrate dehydratase [Haloferula sp. A504]|uniref:NAD(P)H-hydrate dehydratase n=1 Tax=Haloferula sp. A504 TaxID=3373601 RepID=UPI0031BC5DEA|nr:NAD(P)H-hydrate dehydratase [Verrucomicrobiaceae bacterium E54]
MHAVTASEMRALEEAAFRSGTDAGDLMDRAGTGIARRLLDHFPTPGRAVAYLGKGNNAGDALVVLEALRHRGWEVAIRSVHSSTDRSTLTRQRLRRLGIEENLSLPHGPGPLLLLDALLGIGASGAPREPLATLASEMNGLRLSRGALVVGIDLPSGLDADSGESPEGGVIADLTITVGAPKRGLLADKAVRHVGRLMVVPLDELRPEPNDGPVLITPESFPGLLPPRSHDFHKGHAGRVAVLAGSTGMSGAATLAATGALKGGAGLVTLFLDPDNPARTTAEIMVRHSARRVEHAFDSNADALVIGPGLGQPNEPQRDILFERLADDRRPAVLDADALNLIAAAGRTDLLREHHLITPHPGEFARLAPDLAGLPRVEAATRFVARHPCTLLLKGARTVVAAPDAAPRINPTGHAGMASGGQGDVLAGVAGALLASRLAPVDAAALAAWLCGRAAERALTHGDESEQSLTAGDTTRQLGGAFRDWRECRR